jgi:DNA-binding transcriptional MerR regulator
MTIGQIARLANVNVETIRYYESLKLIPKPGVRPSGYREYDKSYIEKINYIKKAKELGFTLKEIRELFRFNESRDVCELAEKKLHEANQKIAEYKYLTNKLQKLIKACPNSGTINECSIIKSIKKNN